MTEHDHDFENEVPEGVDLVLTSMPHERFSEESKRRMERAVEEGEPQDHYHNFEDPSDVQKLLSSRRLELIVELLENDYENISAVADAVGRSYKNVHDDLETLAEYGVVKFDESAKGRSKRPYIPYDNVRVELELGFMEA
ncbi:MAG: transcriptional regulator [Halobacteriales archaeon]|nr:transcriptional regulator [Halobacteriales archaeon]